MGIIEMKMAISAAEAGKLPSAIGDVLEHSDLKIPDTQTKIKFNLPNKCSNCGGISDINKNVCEYCGYSLNIFFNQ